MTTAKKIRQILDDIVKRLEQKVLYLKRNKPNFNSDPEQLKAYHAERDAAVNAMNLAHNRIPDFRVKDGVNYQCPSCWIEREVRSSLDPIMFGTKAKDFFRCAQCGLKVEISFRE